MSAKNAHPPAERCPWKGVLATLVTPFHEDGRVDLRSLESLVDYELEAGVDGLVVGSLSGEALKLSEDERRRVAEAVVKRVGGRRPVLVGVSGTSNFVAVELARHAKENGAAGLVASPPFGSGFAESQIQIFFDELDAAVGLPLIVQDAPHLIRIPLSPHLIAELHRLIPSIVAVKVEALPSSTKMGAIARLAPGIAMFGGLEGAFYVDELERGAAGICASSALPGDLLAITSAFRNGDLDGARRAHARIAELIRFISQSPEFSFHATKRILVRLGVIQSPSVRRPTTPFDEQNERDCVRLATDAGVLPKRAAVS
ncbi:MAG TPA: dihydrodipicolinate synthase family protein [Planctomycetota bacterium]|nr:dihydrodipicolinate synthase family protein [Planctomycetota bacterium]